MPAPLLIPALLLGLGAAGLGWAALSKRPGPSGGAAAKDLAKRVANQGPSGEWVFKPENADSIVKSLSGQTYQYVDPNLDDTVKIAPEPSGKPIPLSNTAMAWVRQQNDAKSILAPLYLATSSPQARFLRAVKPGREQDYTGPETGFAVLLYAGAIARKEAPPGRPPGGGAITPLPDVIPDKPPAVKPNLPILPPPGPSGPAQPFPFPQPQPGPLFTPVNFLPGGDPAPALRGGAKQGLDDLCANGQEPASLEAVAAVFEKVVDAQGRPQFTTEVACLRARAAQLRAQQAVVPLPPLPRPAPPVGPFQPPPPVQPVGPFQPPPPPAPPPAPPAPPPAPPPARPPIIPVVVPPPVLAANFAVVTTQDQPPKGDLIIRATPSMSGPRLPLAGMNTAFKTGTGEPNQIGGAHKNGIVTVLSRISNEGIDWAEIQWNGDNRTSPTNWRAARGFAKAQFLRPTAQAPIAPFPGGGGGVFNPASAADAVRQAALEAADIAAFAGDSTTAGVFEVENPLGRSFVEVGARAPASVHGQGRIATVVSSNGMRLRSAPGPSGATLSLIPAGTRVQLLQVAPGPKGDPRSPGPGGWAQVHYQGRPGWVQSEWLLLV